MSFVPFHESPLANTVKIEHRFQLASTKQFGFRTFWGYDPSFGTPSAAQMTALAADAKGAYQTNLIPIQSNTITLVLTKTTDLNTNLGFVGTNTGNVAGALGGTALPPSATALVNIIVQERYRGGKGRTNVPVGVAANTPDGVSWNAAFITSFSNAYSAYLAAIKASSNVHIVTQVVPNYFHNSQVNPDPSVWDPRNVPLPLVPPKVRNVTNWTLNPRIGSQRRRTALD